MYNYFGGLKWYKRLLSKTKVAAFYGADFTASSKRLWSYFQFLIYTTGNKIPIKVAIPFCIRRLVYFTYWDKSKLLNWACYYWDKFP
jgi:hypothetical protein